ncbi:phosphotransferase [Nocardia takedensis]|uniref:phosphotransferase n=1 Tax=Nocardia takedensis TaxID=259390 RepID=UPI0002F3D4AD
MSVPGSEDSPPPESYRFDERRRMIPLDPESLAARVAAAAPDDVAGHRRTGVECMLLGRYDEALDHLDRALELVDTEARRITLWIDLADVYRYRGDGRTAILLHDRAVAAARAVAPETLSFALAHLGRALGEQGESERARTVLGEALRLRVAEGDPESIEATRVTLLTLARLPIPWPPMVAALLGDAPIRADGHEGRGGGVLRVGDRYWLKRGPHAVAEYERLRWLGDRAVPVPEIAVFESDVLVLADAGAPSTAHAPTPETGALLGEVLRRLHDLPVAECPFDGGLDVTLARARRQVVEGLVDAADFDADNLGRTPRDLLEHLYAARPAEADPVVCHGDFTPANVLTSGIVLDVGALGVADRYRDLALADRDLRATAGPAAVAAFFAAYGEPEPDPERLAYYRVLDELF